MAGHTWLPPHESPRRAPASRTNDDLAPRPTRQALPKSQATGHQPPSAPTQHPRSTPASLAPTSTTFRTHLTNEPLEGSAPKSPGYLTTPSAAASASIPSPSLPALRAMPATHAPRPLLAPPRCRRPPSPASPTPPRSLSLAASHHLLASAHAPPRPYLASLATTSTTFRTHLTNESLRCSAP